MKKLLSILFSLFPLLSIAQLLHPALYSINGYGGDLAESVFKNVTTCSDGGFIVCIFSLSNSGTGNVDSFCSLSNDRTIFLKYNSDASSIEWQKCYPATGDSTILYYFPLANGNAILGGELNANSNGYGFLITKIDNNDNVIWQKCYSRDNAPLLSDMIQTPDGGFIMVGQSFYTDTNATIHHGSWMDPDIWALKLDSNGNKVWSTIIGGSAEDDAISVVNAPHGGCYVFGRTLSNDFDCTGNHGPADAYVVRLDSNGHIVWHRDLGGSGDDGWYGAAVSDGKNGILFTCVGNSIDGDVSNLHGDYDYWVVDLDSSGNIVWNNCYGSIYGEEPYAICKSKDGSIWITGSAVLKSGQVDTSYGAGDAWIVHMDSVGNFLSEKVLGSNQFDVGTMIYGMDNNFVITGGYYEAPGPNGGEFPTTFYGDADFFLATFAPWTTKLPILNNTSPSFTIYPNPCNASTTILSPQQGMINYSIKDISGRTLNTGQFTQTTNIPTTSLPSGLYYIALQTLNKPTTTLKLAVTH